MSACRTIRDVWTQDQLVILWLVSGTKLAEIPLRYLSLSGTFDLQLLKDIAQSLVVEPIELLSADKGRLSALSDAATPDTYHVVCKDDHTRALTPSSGPGGRRRFLPLEEAGLSSSSRSTRSIARQQFREALIARDIVCVATGTHPLACTPSHIVPSSRLDVYGKLYDQDLQEGSLYVSRMGVLLLDDLSRSFDELHWSIYHRDGQYYLHGPALIPDRLKLHGKQLQIGAARVLRELGANEMPDPVLCHWHWTQCMQARIRGYAVWPRLENLGADPNPDAMITEAAQRQSFNTLASVGQDPTRHGRRKLKRLRS